MPVPFETMQEVRASAFRDVAGYCRIDGIAVDMFECHPSFGVDQPVGTCRIVIPAPRPSVLQIGADIEVELGYFGLTRRRFYGQIPDDEYAITQDRYEITITAEGRAAFMRDGDAYGLVFDGPVSLKDFFRGAAASRSIDNYFSEETVYPEGGTIYLGGNEFVDGGAVVIDNRNSPLTVTTRAAKLFGYRVYDRPDGQVTQSLVSGTPNPQFDAGILTADLAIGDYVQAPGNTNVRSGPGTSYDVVGTMPQDGYGMIDGDTVIEADTYLWQQIRAFGVPYGWVAITTPGAPRFTTAIPRQPIYWFVEGTNLYTFKHSRSSGPMVTYWDVRGAGYQDENGNTVALRSIAEDVPSADELRPLGYRMRQFSDQLLVTPELTAGCRNCLEIDTSTLWQGYTAEVEGDPDMQPGEFAAVYSPDNEVYHELQWIMALDEDFSGTSYTATVDLWSGGGESLAPGDDCSTETISTDVHHFGEETLSHYRDPSPDGTEITIDFTVPYSDYSSAVLSGYLHGANTINTNTAVDGSQFEVWQLDDPTQAESGSNELRRVGTITMPSHPEELRKRRNYSSSFKYWQFFRLPMPGNLKMGAAELRIIAGEYESDTYDDGEVTQLKITYCGVGIPTLPGPLE